MFVKLQTYLDRIRNLTSLAEPLLQNRPPAEMTMLGKLRLEQAQVMTSYQLFVHRELFEPLIASGVAAEIARAKQLKVECILVSEDFRAHTRTWNERDPASDWSAYKEAALAMIGRLRAHVDNIERAVAAAPRRPVPRAAMPEVRRFGSTA